MVLLSLNVHLLISPLFSVYASAIVIREGALVAATMEKLVQAEALFVQMNS